MPDFTGRSLGAGEESAIEDQGAADAVHAVWDDPAVRWEKADRVVIRWIFEFDWLDGSATRMEELAYQRWEGDRIAEEQFFYDPAQLAKGRDN